MIVIILQIKAMSSKEKLNPGLSSSTSQEQERFFNLILHNDDVNTFDHVIDSLIEICHHDSNQAEQCAMIVHYKGKCDVKKGEYETLSLMKDQLDSKGLTVSID